MATGVEPIGGINTVVQEDDDGARQCLHSEKCIDVNCIQCEFRLMQYYYCVVKTHVLSLEIRRPEKSNYRCIWRTWKSKMVGWE